MPLSNTAILNAKSTEKAYALTDERGLSIQIQPTGGKWWRFRYRFDGKAKMLSLGIFPDVSLKDAREKMELHRQNKPEIADEKKKQPMAGEYKPLNRANERLGDIDAEMREVRRNYDHSPAEKRDKLDALMVARNALLKAVVMDAKAAQKGNYSITKK